MPSPLKKPEDVDMVIFRENWRTSTPASSGPAHSPEAKKVIDFLIKEMKVKKIRFRQLGIGIKPVSIEGLERLIRKAYQYAIDNKRKTVTLVHKGNIQKFTEGGSATGAIAGGQGVRRQAARRRALAQLQEPEGGPDIVIKDVITDAMLQQVLLRPAEYDVLATTNLNGDYISDGSPPRWAASASRRGQHERHGGHVRGHPRHRAQVRRQGLRQPGSEILSAEMMLRHMGWVEAADAIIRRWKRRSATGSSPMTSRAR